MVIVIVWIEETLLPITTFKPPFEVLKTQIFNKNSMQIVGKVRTVAQNS